MNDHDLIRRGDARRVMLAYASSYSAEQAETAIRALPAIVPQPAPRLPDLGAREAALREAAQCSIDNQDCSPWEVSEAILNLIGKKPAGPHPAASSEDDKLKRTIAARDRRIARLVKALDDARAQGYVTQAEQEPPIVLSAASAEDVRAGALREAAAIASDMGCQAVAASILALIPEAKP